MRSILLFALLTTCGYTFGQTVARVSSEFPVFTVVERMPEFPGGEEALAKFLQNNLFYPQMERDNDIQGKVVVSFIISEVGSVSDVAVKKSVSRGLDKEAMRVINKLPKFKPGMQQGKSVKVAAELPVVFKLIEPAPASR